MAQRRWPGARGVGLVGRHRDEPAATAQVDGRSDRFVVRSDGTGLRRVDHDGVVQGQARVEVRQVAAILGPERPVRRHGRPLPRRSGVAHEQERGVAGRLVEGHDDGRGRLRQRRVGIVDERARRACEGQQPEKDQEGRGTPGRELDVSSPHHRVLPLESDRRRSFVSAAPASARSCCFPTLFRRQPSRYRAGLSVG